MFHKVQDMMSTDRRGDIKTKKTAKAADSRDHHKDIYRLKAADDLCHHI